MPNFSEKTFLLLAVLSTLMLPIFCFGQTKIDRNYYQFPIKPGTQGFLAAKMGEIRNNHFHAGLDIKTGGVSGWSVTASAEGYVYRVKVSAHGYGNVMYLQHPNGQRSLYAHLQSFDPALAQYILEQQYAQQSFEIELYPPAGKFRFAKGQEIAKAGNTGASSAPHLHFEIRDGQDLAINPLLFDFPEIKDQVPPIVKKLAIRPLDMFGRVDGQFGRSAFNLMQKGSDYHIYEPIQAYGGLGIELLAFDKANGVENLYGIYRLEMRMDGHEIYTCQIDEFTFDESRRIHTYINYPHYKARSESFQKCYIDDGNLLPFYGNHQSKGKLWIAGDRLHEMEMRLFDIYGNQTKVFFKLKGNKSYVPAKWSNLLGENYRLEGNTLYFYQVPSVEGKTADLQIDGIPYQINPAYRLGDANVYLWNLGNGIPSEIGLTAADGRKETHKPNIARAIPSGITYFFSNDNFDLFFPKDALYDTLYLRLEAKGMKFSISDRSVPMFRAMEVAYRPSMPVSDLARTKVYRINGRSNTYVGGTWEGGQIRFPTRDLGNFELLTDVSPPSVNLIEKSQNAVSFRISDDLSGIQSYKATLNGEFLLMEYDPNLAKIWSKRLDPNKPLRGLLEVTVVDMVGNKGQLQINL